MRLTPPVNFLYPWYKHMGIERRNSLTDGLPDIVNTP